MMGVSGRTGPAGRRRRSSRLGEDAGVVTMLLAVLLGGGVLLAAGALVVDVGQLYAEREQLQSGADSAALAVARNCVANPAGCAGQAATLAGQYANANAKDGTSAVSVICGTGPGLPSCPPQPAGRAACLGAAPAGASYAEVRTATRTQSGSTLLPPTFARALAGQGNDQGTAVHACARVAWGPPAAATGLAITVSQCNWQVMTGNGAQIPTDEQVIYLHDPHTADPASALCAKDPSGKTAPGGFGFLSANAGTCQATGQVNTSWAGSTGNSSQGCETPLGNLRASQQPIPLPIYDTVTGTGNNTTYHILGFGAFIVTGWSLSGTSAASNVLPSSTAPKPAATYCTGASRCLYGYFTTQLMTIGQFAATTNYGLSLVKTTG